MNAAIEASADWQTAAQLRAEMALEMGTDWDASFSGWRERYIAFFAGRAKHDEAQLYIARDGNHVAGMAIVSYLQHYRTAAFGTKYGYVNGVFVRPAYRRRGIATALMESTHDWARGHGCTAIRLRASEAGTHLYRSLGYLPTTEMERKL